MNKEALLKKRAALVAQMQEMNTRSAAFNEDEQKKWDQMASEIRAIDAELKRLEEADELLRDGNQHTTATPQATAGTVDAQQEREAATKAERQRVSEVTALCAHFGVEARAYIDGGTSVDQVRAEIIKQQMAANPPLAANRAAEVGDEAIDKFCRAAHHAILLRSGVDISLTNRARNAQMHAGAEELAGRSLRDLMIEYRRLSGHADGARMEGEALARASLTPTSQFTGVLNNVIGSSLQAGYNVQPTTFQGWTVPGSNPNFKATKRFRMSEAGIPLEIPQSGEFKFDEMTDENISASLKTYGRKFGVTRQLVIDDDLGYLVRIPMAYMQAARRGLNRACYDLLNSAQTIYDGGTWFNATAVTVGGTGHANYNGTGAYPSAAAFGAMKLAMRKQQNLRLDENLNLIMDRLVAPPELEDAIDKIINPNYVIYPTTPGAVNNAKGMYQLIVDGELTDAQAYFGFCSPQVAPCVEVTYLNGREMPYLEMQQSFDYLGMEWRLYFDWGLTITDFRGAYKNKGAAAT